MKPIVSAVFIAIPLLVLPAPAATPLQSPAAPVVRTSSTSAGAIATPFNGHGDVLEKIREGAAGTYIDDILLDHDSAIARWPDRTAHPVRVWIQPASGVRDWSPDFVHRTRDAFDIWGHTGIPVQFAFVRDSADADVVVAWIDHFDEPISGKTVWARDEGYWILDANIRIAVHYNGGAVLDPASIRAIALHEVGHMLGLDHTPDQMNIMAPRVRVRTLSAADIATARLLYTLPPGTVR